MKKCAILLLNFLLISACANNDSLIKTPNQDQDVGYFADATKCSAAAMRHETILLPSPTLAGSIDIPMGYDADKFQSCMTYAGRPVDRGDSRLYFQVSEDCLSAARKAEHADLEYADCIKRSHLQVEVIDKE